MTLTRWSFRRFKQIYAKVDHMLRVISYFSLHSWVFFNDNTTKLYSDLSKQDQSIFDFDFAALDWSSYLKTFGFGVRVYLLKDPVETVPFARRRRIYLEYLHYVVCTAVALLLYGVLKLIYMLLV